MYIFWKLIDWKCDPFPFWEMLLQGWMFSLFAKVCKNKRFSSFRRWEQNVHFLGLIKDLQKFNFVLLPCEYSLWTIRRLFWVHAFDFDMEEWFLQPGISALWNGFPLRLLNSAIADVLVFLERIVSRDFSFPFLHQTTSPGPIWHAKKGFGSRYSPVYSTVLGRDFPVYSKHWVRC